MNQARMTHEERIEIAERLKKRILEAYGDSVRAVFVTSSTAKGLDLPHSDLELTAVIRDGVELEAKSYVYRGILIEIEYPQESTILKTARRVTARWPIEADGYRNRLVLFDRDGWIRYLDAAVQERDASDFTRGLRLAVTTVIEDRDKLRNVLLEEDELPIRVFGAQVAFSAANLVLFLNRRYMITTRRFYTQAFECSEQPPEFRRRVEVLLGVVPATLEEVAEAAEHLCADVVGMAKSRGVSVESDELIV